MILTPWRWPLRRQISALGLMALVTVVLATVLALQSLRQTETARVTEALRQLNHTLGQLVKRYAYVHASFSERHMTDPLSSGDEQFLHSLTEATLAGAPGIEGGFFSVQNGQLLGYAYPTYQGTGPETDIPSDVDSATDSAERNSSL